MALTDVPALIGAMGGLLGGVAAVYVALRRRAIERYVTELDRVSYEHHVVFARLHERRINVIADLYKKLVDAEVAFGSWLHPLQASNVSQEEKGQVAIEAGEALQRAFLHNRIWLDEDLCDRLGVFTRTLHAAFIDFTTYDPGDPRTKSEHLKMWREAWKTIENETAPLRLEIEARFREMLGVLSSR